jgi:malonyl-CoA O-methyltransferase
MTTRKGTTWKETKRVTAREGYDLWAGTYDGTPNPVVAMDSRHTLNLLDPRPGQRILDAGCGTGRNLARIRLAGAQPYGLDLSLGMLRVARNNAPNAPVAQADLQAELPFRSATFSAVLCALIGEHLEKLAFTLSQLWNALQPGGWLVFSVYHPDLAEAGKEANFELGQTEYRLGAIRYTTADYLQMTWDAGFREIGSFEYKADQRLIEEIPSAAELLAKPVIFALRAQRPGTEPRP